MKKNKTLTKVNLDKNSIKIKYILEIKTHLSENQAIATQKRLPKAREEMIELLVKEEEQLKAGDKNFDFGKFIKY
jgi:hypothetical protein